MSTHHPESTEYVFSSADSLESKMDVEHSSRTPLLGFLRVHSFLIITGIMIFFSDSSAGTVLTGKSGEPSFPFKRVLASYSSDDAFFSFNLINGANYTISAHGNLSISDGKSNPHVVHLKFEKKCQHVAGVEFLEHNESLFIIYEREDRCIDGCSSFLTRIDRNKMKSVWTAHVPTGNVTGTLSNDGFIYAAGTGFVSKLDAETGRYIWKHTGLYKTSHEFNIFAPPKEEAGAVIFTGHSGAEHIAHPKSIFIHKESGKIIRIVDEPSQVLD